MVAVTIPNRHWFPDSQNLAFTSGQAGRPQVYKVNINGGAPQRITWEGSQNQDADVSSDGKFMVMVSSNGGQQHVPNKIWQREAYKFCRPPPPPPPPPPSRSWMKRQVWHLTALW